MMNLRIVAVCFSCLTLVGLQARQRGASAPAELPGANLIVAGDLKDALTRALKEGTFVPKEGTKDEELQLSKPIRLPVGTLGSASGGGVSSQIGGGKSSSAAAGVQGEKADIQRTVEYQIGFVRNKPAFVTFEMAGTQTISSVDLLKAVATLSDAKAEIQMCVGDFVCVKYDAAGRCEKFQCVPKKK